LETKHGTSFPILLLGVLSLIWGTSFILMKKGLVALSPVEVAAFRITVAGVLLLPIALLKWREVKREQVPKLLVSGLLGVFIPAFLFTTAQQHIDSSVAGILNTLSPLWTLIMGVLFYQQIFRRPAVIGILVGLTGTVLLMLSRNAGSVTGLNAYGLLIVAACAFYGLNLNFVKFNITNLGSLAITSVSIALIGPLGALVLFGMTDFVHTLNVVPGAWTAAGYVALLALMSTAIAGLIFNKLVRITTPLYASMVTYIMPLVSVMWGVLDGERLYASHFIGMAAILGGVYLANRRTMNE
jgi:drug/metabolite transporter (DMT)-like permease